MYNAHQSDSFNTVFYHVTSNNNVVKKIFIFPNDEYFLFVKKFNGRFLAGHKLSRLPNIKNYFQKDKTSRKQ